MLSLRRLENTIEYHAIFVQGQSIIFKGSMKSLKFSINLFKIAIENVKWPSVILFVCQHFVSYLFFYCYSDIGCCLVMWRWLLSCHVTLVAVLSCDVGCRLVIWRWLPSCHLIFFNLPYWFIIYIKLFFVTFVKSGSFIAKLHNMGLAHCWRPNSDHYFKSM